MTTHSEPAAAPSVSAPGTGPVITHAGSRYLEAVYYIEQEGIEPRAARLSDWLGVSLPTITQGIAKLVRDGFLTTSGRVIGFTPQGLVAAQEIVRRHRVAEVWLNSTLGLDWASADLEAQEIADSLSDVVVERMLETLGQPTTCPHGNAIPGQPQRVRTLVRLTDLDDGGSGKVARISEVAERDAPELLTLLQGWGMRLGQVLTVVDRDSSAGTITLDRGTGSRATLPAGPAASVWVEPAPGSAAAAG